MNFKELAHNFDSGPSGTDQFKILYRGAQQLMKLEPENAALYFVISVAAQAYVMRYEDQAVTTELAESAKATLVGFNAKIRQALAADAATRLTLLGEIASEYQFRVTSF